MIPKKGPDILLLKEQLKAILSFKLVTSSKSILEKLFWFIISFGGTIYITYIVCNQINYWERNPVLKTSDKFPLSKLKSPAITFCHKGIQKYALIEKLGNYIDCNKTIPEEIYNIRNSAIKIQVNKIKSQMLTSRVIDFCQLQKKENGNWIIKESVSVLNKDCQDFGRNVYMTSKKFDIPIEEVNAFVFDLIKNQKLWNLTDAFSKIKEAFSQVSFKQYPFSPKPKGQILKQVVSFIERRLSNLSTKGNEYTHCIECNCSTILVQYYNSQKENSYAPKIFGYYVSMKEMVNEHLYYESQSPRGQFAIWFCEKNQQWFLGVTEEKGLCKGYAYINSTSDCFLCNGPIGWRILDNKWSLAKPQTIQTSCFIEKDLEEKSKHVLITGGTSAIRSEVVDVKDFDNVCETKQVLERWAAVGESLSEQILICGGKSKLGGRHQNCTIFGDSNAEIQMLDRRYGAASIAINQTTMWITGGNNGSNDLNTSEFVSLAQGAVAGPTLSFAMSFHCMVKFNSSTAMIIGGQQNGTNSEKCWFVNFATGFIKEGNSLNVDRRLMSCEKIIKDSENIIIVVAGGKDLTGASLDTIEIFNSALGHWTLGAKLPFRVSKSIMIPSQAGDGVILIGGWNNNEGKVSDTMLEMKSNHMEWQILNTTMAFGRQYPLAFRLPKRQSNCGKCLNHLDVDIELFYDTKLPYYQYFDVYGKYRKSPETVNEQSYYEKVYEQAYDKIKSRMGMWWACGDRWCINNIVLFKGQCNCNAYYQSPSKCLPQKFNDWNWVLYNGSTVGWKYAERQLGVREFKEMPNAWKFVINQNGGKIKASSTYNVMINNAEYLNFESSSDVKNWKSSGIENEWLEFNFQENVKVMGIRTLIAQGSGTFRNYMFQYHSGSDWVTIFSGIRAADCCHMVQQKLPLTHNKKFRLFMIDSYDSRKMEIDQLQLLFQFDIALKNRTLEPNDLDYFEEFKKWEKTLERSESNFLSDDMKIFINQLKYAYLNSFLNPLEFQPLNNLGSFVHYWVANILDSGHGNDTFPVISSISKLMTMKGNNMDLLEFAKLITINDYQIMDYLVKQKETFVSTRCLESMIEKYRLISSKEDFDTLLKPIPFIEMSPCMVLQNYSECEEFCRSFSEMLQILSKEELLILTRYALPQKSVVEDHNYDVIKVEQDLAKKLFGNDNIKEFKNVTKNPTPLMIYCQNRLDEAFAGIKIAGFSAKFCDAFHPTPSDVGMCLTNNLDIKEILHENKELFTYMGADLQNTASAMGKGNRNAESTLVLQHDLFEHLNSDLKFKTMFPRTIHRDLNIQMQINGNRVLPNILFSDIQEISTKSITLKPQHEYTIEVSINGQTSTAEFYDLSLDDRNCRFENEVMENSSFKTYSQSNCRYECHVSMVFKICKCIPWDFISHHSSPECDVFGRTCFFHAMEKIKHDATDFCQHCIEDCNKLTYHAKVTQSKSLSLSDVGNTGLMCTEEHYICTGKSESDNYCIGSKMLCEYAVDQNNSFIESELKNLAWPTITVRGLGHDDHEETRYFRKLRSFTRNMIIIKLKFKSPFVDMTVLDSRTTLSDKISKLGGTYGLWVQLTGCALLVLVNVFVVAIKMGFKICK